MKRWVPIIAVWLAGCATTPLISYSYRTELVPEAQPKKATIEATVQATLLQQGIELSIRNAGTASVNVLWDECAYVDPEQHSHRVVTSHSRRITMNLAQPPTPIPPGTSMSETVIPADYIGSDDILALFPMFQQWSQGPSGYNAPAHTLVGKEVGVLIMLECNGVKESRLLRFRISEVYEVPVPI